MLQAEYLEHVLPLKNSEIAANTIIFEFFSMRPTGPTSRVQTLPCTQIATAQGWSSHRDALANCRDRGRGNASRGALRARGYAMTALTPAQMILRHQNGWRDGKADETL